MRSERPLEGGRRGAGRRECFEGEEGIPAQEGEQNCGGLDCRDMREHPYSVLCYDESSLIWIVDRAKGSTASAGMI